MLVAVVTWVWAGRVVSPDRRPRPAPGDIHGAFGRRDLPPAVLPNLPSSPPVRKLGSAFLQCRSIQGEGVLVGAAVTAVNEEGRF